MTRRFFRLAPSAFLWALILLLYSALLPSYERFLPPSWIAKEVLGTVFYIYNFFVHFDILLRDDVPKYMGYYWTLSLEWQLYILLSASFLFCGKRIRILCLLVALIAFALFPSTTGFVWFRMDAFLWGSLIAHIPETFRLRIGHYLSPKNPIAGFLAMLAVSALYLYAFRLLLLSPFFSIKYLLPLLGVFSALSVFLAGCGLKFGLRRVTDSFFCWIGERSYSIYLIHLPVVYWSNEAYFRLVGRGSIPAGGGPVFVLSALTLLLVLASLNYRFVERPIRKLGARLATKLAPNAPRTGALVYERLSPQAR